MIAGILSPLSVATALYFPWSGGKCLSTVPRGTTGQKKQALEFLPRPDPVCARGPLLHLRADHAERKVVDSQGYVFDPEDE
jgi:hypothetical protein